MLRKVPSFSSWPQTQTQMQIHGWGGGLVLLISRRSELLSSTPSATPRVGPSAAPAGYCCCFSRPHCYMLLQYALSCGPGNWVLFATTADGRRGLVSLVSSSHNNPIHSFSRLLSPRPRFPRPPRSQGPTYLRTTCSTPSFSALSTAPD